MTNATAKNQQTNEFDHVNEGYGKRIAPVGRGIRNWKASTKQCFNREH